MRKKVMVFGTFDIVHQGHLNFFKQARALGTSLTVVIARNINVGRIKGNSPDNDEKIRLDNVRKTGLADLVILGHLNDPYQIIREEQPDVIALGYDQNSYDKPLQHMFPTIEIIRLKPFHPERFKSSKLK